MNLSPPPLPAGFQPPSLGRRLVLAMVLGLCFSSLTTHLWLPLSSDPTPESREAARRALASASMTPMRLQARMLIVGRALAREAAAAREAAQAASGDAAGETGDSTSADEGASKATPDLPTDPAVQTERWIEEQFRVVPEEMIEALSDSVRGLSILIVHANLARDEALLERSLGKLRAVSEESDAARSDRLKPPEVWDGTGWASMEDEVGPLPLEPEDAPTTVTVEAASGSRALEDGDEIAASDADREPDSGAGDRSGAIRAAILALYDRRPPPTRDEAARMIAPDGPLGAIADAFALDLARRGANSPLPPGSILIRAAFRESLATALDARDLRRPLAPEELAALEEPLDEFARIARLDSLRLAGDPSADALEREIEDDAKVRTAILGALLLVGLAAFVGGLVVFALFLRRAGSGRLEERFESPETPPHLLLEAFALYLLMFLLAPLLPLPESARGPSGSIFWNVGLQLLALTTLAWPALAGPGGFPALRRSLGLHAGDGIGPEALRGPLGYMAFLPMAPLAVMAGEALREGLRLDAGEGMHPVAPMLEAAGDPVARIGIVVLAVVIAPIVEEILFRGALYGALRVRWEARGAAILSALIFAAIHPQGWVGLPALFFIGFMLAALREWRGSLVAPIVAHMCVNGATMTLLFALG